MVSLNARVTIILLACRAICIGMTASCGTIGGTIDQAVPIAIDAPDMTSLT